MNFLNIEIDHTTRIATPTGLPEQVHVFDKDSIDAINAALAARRPLLVRGEPGVGKSQLARAAAIELKRGFVQHVVDVHCEPRDLLWHFDAVQRLADAQLGKALGKNPDEIKAKLNVKNYLQPGPLWWAYQWNSAEKHSQAQAERPAVYDGCNLENGLVLLIDEIDKAESDVPNGLLEALGEGRFTPLNWDQPICASEPYPLVIITSNEERTLPNAFLRRCLILHLDLFSNNVIAGENKAEKKDPFTILVERGQAHFPELDRDTVIETAANLLIEDRAVADAENRQPKPGQAEFLDLLRAVDTLSKQGKGSAQDLISQVARFTLDKQFGIEP